MHGRFIGAVGHVPLGVVDLCSHVLKSIGKIVACLEFDQHEAAALIGRGAHFLDTSEPLQCGLNRTQEHALRILGGDALIAEAHIDNRYGDVGFGLFGDRLIGHRARDQEKYQDRKRQPSVVDGNGDRIHRNDAPASSAYPTSGTRQPGGGSYLRRRAPRSRALPR